MIRKRSPPGDTHVTVQRVPPMKTDERFEKPGPLVSRRTSSTSVIFILPVTRTESGRLGSAGCAAARMIAAMASASGASATYERFNPSGTASARTGTGVADHADRRDPSCSSCTTSPISGQRARMMTTSLRMRVVGGYTCTPPCAVDDATVHTIVCTATFGWVCVSLVNGAVVSKCSTPETLDQIAAVTTVGVGSCTSRTTAPSSESEPARSSTHVTVSRSPVPGDTGSSTRNTAGGSASPTSRRRTSTNCANRYGDVGTA